MKTINQNDSEWPVVKEAVLACWGRGLRGGPVVSFRTHPTSSQPCWTEMTSFSWKRTWNILKNLCTFFIVSPDFDSLAREERQCGQM